MHLDRTLVVVLVTAAIGSSCSPRVPEELPRLDFVESDGCADVFLFAVNDDGSEFLIADAAVDTLELQMERETSFPLDEPPPGLRVWLDVYDDPPLIPEYCADFHTGEQPTARWTAVAGRISITLRDREAGASADVPGTYRASVVLDDLALEDDSGRRITAGEPIEIAANVGWTAG